MPRGCAIFSARAIPAGAKQQLERLAKLAPESPELKDSRDEMKSSTGDGRQELQQARLLGVAGKVDEAIAAYEKLFNGVPDDDDAAIEYWTLVARLPAVITKASIS